MHLQDWYRNANCDLGSNGYHYGLYHHPDEPNWFERGIYATFRPVISLESRKKHLRKAKFIEAYKMTSNRSVLVAASYVNKVAFTIRVDAN